jgi:hypothetical protein
VNPTFDGLRVPWGQSNYINPPYEDIGSWLKKALHEMGLGKHSVFLIPLRMNRRYYCQSIMPYAKEIRLLKHFVAFKGYSKAARWRSCIVVFDPLHKPTPETRIAELYISPRGRHFYDMLQTLVERRREGQPFRRIVFGSAETNKEILASDWDDEIIVIQREIWLFLDKAAEVAEQGRSNVLVVPFRPEAAYFMEKIMFAPAIKEILVMGTTLQFPGFSKPSPHGSLILLYGPRYIPTGAVGPKFLADETTPLGGECATGDETEKIAGG